MKVINSRKEKHVFGFGFLIEQKNKYLKRHIQFEKNDIIITFINKLGS